MQASKRQRVDAGEGTVMSMSCTNCRRRHEKCDRVSPRCGNCSRNRLTCSYVELRKRGPRRGARKILESRITALEQALIEQQQITDTYKQQLAVAIGEKSEEQSTTSPTPTNKLLIGGSQVPQQSPHPVANISQPSQMRMNLASEVYSYLARAQGTAFFPVVKAPMPEITIDEIMSRKASPESMTIYAELANGAMVARDMTKANEFSSIAKSLADQLIDSPNFQTAAGLCCLSFYTLANCDFKATMNYLGVADAMCAYLTRARGLQRGSKEEMITVACRLSFGQANSYSSMSQLVFKQSLCVLMKFKNEIKERAGSTPSTRDKQFALITLTLMMSLETIFAGKFNSVDNKDLLYSWKEEAQQLHNSIAWFDCSPFYFGVLSQMELAAGNLVAAQEAANTVTVAIEARVASASPFTPFALKNAHVVHTACNATDWMARDVAALKILTQTYGIAKHVLGVMQSIQPQINIEAPSPSTTDSADDFGGISVAPSTVQNVESPDFTVQKQFTSPPLSITNHQPSPVQVQAEPMAERQQSLYLPLPEGTTNDLFYGTQAHEPSNIFNEFLDVGFTDTAGEIDSLFSDVLPHLPANDMSPFVN